MNDCLPTSCSSHLYMEEGLKEMRKMSTELSKGQQTLELSIVKLTENFYELQRFNNKLEQIIVSQNKKDDEQDTAIAKQRDFMNKALGVVSALTIIIPIVSGIVQYILTH